MKINFIKYLVSTAIVAAIGATAHAEEVPRSQQAISSLPALTSQINPILAEVADNSLVESGAVELAPAPPLSAMWVYAVGSSDCGWESTAGLMTTTCNHGGAALRAAVLEIGYGSSSIAWMSGSVLPNSAQYASTPVCVTGNYYTWPCTAGQTVVGWLVEYNLDGRQNGTFKYKNTSTNSPWNTMSVQINIL
ncbi:YolA family protein [Vibrio ruber]|uniref:YolA family protein n=1 Tax=Vibrio ruber TaxID=184755 RepID=UPI002892CCB1|nr:YolA family protein [Vibrio ruber]WNJ95950.1 YolA family protein [Vibrio ruber]